MENKLMLILDGVDITELDEDTLSELVIKEFEKKGYIIQDRPAVVRVGKVSSLRATDKKTMEEVELYTLAQVLKKGDIIKTVITATIV
ncbi:MAG: hypothetical protein GXO45_05380 [Aquificae bacterium]|nr:hypothetical protein [Aquificota bacterium]